MALRLEPTEGLEGQAERELASAVKHKGVHTGDPAASPPEMTSNALASSLTPVRVEKTCYSSCSATPHGKWGYSLFTKQPFWMEGKAQKFGGRICSTQGITLYLACRTISPVLS